VNCLPDLDFDTDEEQTQPDFARLDAREPGPMSFAIQHDAGDAHPDTPIPFRLSTKGAVSLERLAEIDPRGLVT
jgi:hypothetical protein